jgi:hypothetical protein
MGLRTGGKHMVADACMAQQTERQKTRNSNQLLFLRHHQSVFKVPSRAYKTP